MSRGDWLPSERDEGWFSRRDPRLKLAWIGWVSAVSVAVDRLPALIVLASLCAATVTGVRISWVRWRWIALLLLATAWGTVLSQALFYADLPRTPLVTLVPPGRWLAGEFPGLALYREGVTYGLTQSLRLLSVAWTGLAVALSTSPDRLLVALAWLRVPALVSVPVSAALRFLPVLAEEWQQTRAAWHARWRCVTVGQSLPRRSRWSRWRESLSLVEPVLAVSLRRARLLAASITSRGFDPSAPRTAYPALKFSLAERLALSLLGLSLVALLAAKMLYWLYLAQWMYRPALRPLYALAREWL